MKKSFFSLISLALAIGLGVPVQATTPLYNNMVIYQYNANGDLVPITLQTGPNQNGYVLGIGTNGNGQLLANPNVTAATTSVMGGVIVPASGRLTVDVDGNIGVPIATTSVLGVVKPDGTILTIAGNGALTAAKASSSAFGVAEVDNVTLGSTAGVIAMTGNNIPLVTAGSGSGISTVYAGKLGRQILKITITHTALSAGAKTADATIATIAAKTRIVGIIMDSTIDFAGGGESAATMSVGVTAGGTGLLLAADVFTAPATYGLADADLGASMTRAAAIQGGFLPSWTGSTTISCRLTTTTNNTSALTTGSATFYLITESM